MGVCIITPILVGLISAYLGYLLGNHDQKQQLEEIQELKEENNALRSELLVFKNKVKTPQKNINIPFDAKKAKTFFGKTIRENDLKIIDGIGPKIETLFKNNNITTWKTLSETSVEKCQEILNKGGDRFKMHKPNTWPKQALYAYHGKWNELKTFHNKEQSNKL